MIPPSLKTINKYPGLRASRLTYETPEGELVWESHGCEEPLHDLLTSADKIRTLTGSTVVRVKYGSWAILVLGNDKSNLAVAYHREQYSGSKSLLRAMRRTLSYIDDNIWNRKETKNEPGRSSTKAT